MKKVAIVSCYFQKNYGSMLQAYATQKILDDLNIENETICIDGLRKEINKKKINHYAKQIFNPQVITGTVLRIIKKQVIKRSNKKFKNDLSIRDKAFLDFQKRFKISQKFESKAELSQYCSNYSSVIVGSDQLWLPSNIDADYYTLTWVPDEVNKIAYSTSFGTSFLPKYQHEFVRKFLNRFNHISVREQTGQQIIKDLTGKDVSIVCDPTLLFNADEWAQIQSKERIIKDKYIFCYFLGNNKDDRMWAKKLKEYTGFKIVALQHLDEYIKSDEGFADISPYNINPADFISLIRDAEYICTDSFHGSVFSIINKKKFFTFRRFKKEGILCTNNRLDSLFNMLGIKDRMLTGNEDVKDCISRDLDYIDIHNRLNEFVKESKDYLKNALEGNV